MVTRVLIVEDHQMLAEGLAMAFGASPDLEVCGRASTLAEAGLLARQTRADVVVLDRRLPDGDGLTVLPELVALGCRVLVLTAEADGALVTTAVEAGAHGVLLKEAGLDRLTDAVRKVAAGESVLAPELAARLVERMSGRGGAVPQLTSRESEVLALLDEGASTEDMAARLYLSTNTIRNHVQRLLNKLGAHSKVEALAIARKSGLL